MGSIDSATRTVGGGDETDEFRVLITGFGPAVRVSYDTVRELVPRLWDQEDCRDDDEEVVVEAAGEETSSWSSRNRGGGGYDLALHIGMAGPPVRYSIERRGHRDGYRHRDVDGKYLEDDKRREREGDDWIWHGVPEELLTDLDIEDIYKRWVGRCPDGGESGPELRISEDPGHYLCDFIYFTSLAHLYKQQRTRNVLFLHVPASGTAESVQTGTELATQLLRAMVESEVERRSKASKGLGPIS
ncbi:hypothetical protein G7054_g15237 [Neopestalotiopsis clavispora]|nr:hypothetical protein G7054_g15237 [Neopestalotiopsis clavispora]